MIIEAEDSLRTVAFKVCTAMTDASITAVLTGGSAATVYAPHAYQSLDLDFVLHFAKEAKEVGDQTLKGLEYRLVGETYVHESNPLTLDFIPSPIAIGGDVVTTWDTLRENDLVLNILSPTDCCRDRLAHFLHWNDLAGWPRR